MTVAQRILVKFYSPVADSGQFRMSLGFSLWQLRLSGRGAGAPPGQPPSGTEWGGSAPVLPRNRQLGTHSLDEGGGQGTRPLWRDDAQPPSRGCHRRVAGRSVVRDGQTGRPLDVHASIVLEARAQRAAAFWQRRSTPSACESLPASRGANSGSGSGSGSGSTGSPSETSNTRLGFGAAR